MRNVGTSIPAYSGRSRALYEAAAGKYGKRGGVVITQSYLSLWSAALSTQGSISFAMGTNQTAAGATSIGAQEKRLSLNDYFLATEIGFFTARQTTKARLDTFPNSLIYSKSGEADNFQSIYNGSMNVKVNGKDILASWDMLRHYRVANAQKSVLTAASGTGNAWDASTWDSVNFGFAPLSPAIEFQGQGKNEITVNLPASVDLTPTSGSNYAVIILRGLLIQNAGIGVQG